MGAEKEKEEREKTFCGLFCSKKKAEKKVEFKEVTTETNIVDSTCEIATETQIETEEHINNIKMNLQDIDFKVKKGSCVAIIGKTGSGKTSLLNSMFNEMYMSETDGVNPLVKIKGSVSYLPQSAKLMSKTVKENILFYSEYNEEKYKN